MKTPSSRIVLLALVLLTAAGCKTAGKRTAIGAGVGAVVGGATGAVLGKGKGAIIGAGVGALAGGSVGLYLDKQAAELEKVAQTKRTEHGVLVQLQNDILFDVDSAVLKPAAVEQLTRVADIIAKYGDDRVRIEGHTDSTGKASHNEALSLRRADAVQRVLAGRGVKGTQMMTLGLAATRPVADNKTAASRAQNRRVELHIDVPEPT